MKNLSCAVFLAASCMLGAEADLAESWTLNTWSGYEPLAKVERTDRTVHVSDVQAKYGFGMRSGQRFLRRYVPESPPPPSCRAYRDFPCATTAGRRRSDGAAPEWRQSGRSARRASRRRRRPRRRSLPTARSGWLRLPRQIFRVT